MKKLKLALLLLSTLALSHHGAIGQEIYPQPHKITQFEAQQSIPICCGVNIYQSSKVDKATLNALLELTSQNKRGITTYIGTVGSNIERKLKSLKINLPAKSGAYYLKVDKEQISILGYDSRGTFYAIQTLRQLINPDGTLPMVEIVDYPDIAFRGVVEGFYGTPWSHHDRISQLKFYGRNKLNTYIYGPKDDPYHSSLSGHSTSTNKDAQGGWRVPYPEAEAAKIHELVEVAKANKVDFVWAIHPGQDIKWNDEDFNLLINKFEKMYDLGVRSYAVFFDDISGDGTDAHKQAQLLNKINNEFIEKKGDVTPLIMCPTEYNKSWSNPNEDGYLPTLGRELHPSIQIMWTGDSVCANITMSTLEWINSRIKRPTYIWWNFPVTDYARHILAQGPAYGLDTKATSEDMNGFTSNPMEHAEASKLALFGVADYTWNIADYKYLNAWEAGIKEILPEASKAYRTFAIHSSDYEKNGHNFRRDESWETNILNPKSYTKEEFKALKDEFHKIKAAPKTILESGGNEYLIKEMEPWLLEFEKLGKRGVKALRLLKAYDNGDLATIWTHLLKVEMSKNEATSYNAHKSGTLKLQPFIDQVFNLALDTLNSEYFGNNIIEQSASSSFSNTVALEKALDSDSKTYYYSQQVFGINSHFTIDLGEETEVKNILIEQGRHDGDRDYFKGGVIEYSLDNQNWTPVIEFEDKSYSMSYNSTPFNAQYIRLRNTADTKKDPRWFALRSFIVNKTQSEPIISTNVNQVASANIKSLENNISIQPMLEIIKLQSGDYFGIELPVAAQIASVDVDLNIKNAQIEYSLDSKEWSSEMPKTAKFIRFTNKSSKAIDIKLNKFEVKTASQSGGNLVYAVDKDLLTGAKVKPNSPISIAVPQEATKAIVLIKGKLLINGVEATRYHEFELDSATQQITIEGKGSVREIIFR